MKAYEWIDPTSIPFVLSQQDIFFSFKHMRLSPFFLEGSIESVLGFFANCTNPSWMM